MKYITFLTVVSLGILLGCKQSPKAQSQQAEWALAMHGGAGVIPQDMPDSIKQNYYEGLEEALSVGQEILSEGGSALDAVEMTIRTLENNPLFNAGRGAVYTSEGKHELDAAIMDGSTLAAGAVTGVTTVKNPITLARKVMTDSRHIFFSGEGAEEYANRTGVKRVENDYYDTERRFEQWQQSQEKSHLLDTGDIESNNSKYGTVGAVALDQSGKLAAATSTGGMTNKQFGRVGDVPIIGSGTFANHVAAISATGWGEQIMRNVSANTIANYMEFNNRSLEEAMNFVLTERLNPGDAGFIGVDSKGNISMQMNTIGMFRGSVDSNGNKRVMIWKDE